MSGKTSNAALYRRYRSRKLEDVVGQQHVTATLSNALKQGKLSHAYLFVGPRGVGKTSVARILAHEVNGLKYDGSSNHLDIIEIDAASNRGIDEIRELRDKVHLAPSSADFKVYIIDEVHMLTAPAFSALLKTLEEPPAHVIFIMATTEGHKIPATIASRSQRFTFLPVAADQMEKHLASVAKQENIKIEAKALNLIAEYGYGSLRDALSLLDQLSHLPQIKADDAERLIGIAPEVLIKKIVGALDTHNAPAIFETSELMRQTGVSPAIVARQLIEEIRKSRSADKKQIALYDELLDVATSAEPELKLEAVLLAHTLEDEPSGSSKRASQENLSPAQAKHSSAKKLDTASDSQSHSSSVGSEERPLDDSQWHKLLGSIKTSHNSLYAVLRQAQPVLSQDELILKFKFSFHKDRVSENRNKRVVEDAASRILDTSVTVRASHNPEIKQKPIKPAPQSEFSTVAELMGGGEIMDYSDGR